MASIFNAYVNSVKYQKLEVNSAGSWVYPKEVHVKNGTTWVEPKRIFVNKAGTWTPVTQNVRWVPFDGSATYLGTSTANAFNNYLTGGTAYTRYSFYVVFGGSGIRTLFSYGNGSVSYFIIEIGSDNKVYVKSRYNSGTAYSIAHATALTAGTYYNITVYARQTSTYRLKIEIFDANNNIVGTHINSNSLATFSTSSYGKFIGKNYGNTNYFNGTMYNFYLHGANYAETATISSADEYINSTVGGTTVEGGTYDWTIYGGEVITETG